MIQALGIGQQFINVEIQTKNSEFALSSHVFPRLKYFCYYSNVFGTCSPNIKLIFCIVPKIG